MQGIPRASFLANPPRQVSTTFVRFQWGNGSHCHECLNMPTFPRRSYGLFCLNEFSGKQARTTRVTKPNSKFFSVKGTETTSIFHSSPSNAVQPHSEQTNSKILMTPILSCVLNILLQDTDLILSPRSGALNRGAVQAESPDPCLNRALRDATEDSRLGSRRGQCSCGACAPGCRCRAPAAQTQIHDC